MAKRKVRPEGGSKLRPIKDYHSEEYVSYILKAETGILQAWAFNRDMRDGDVRQALRGLIAQLQKSGALPELLTGSPLPDFKINPANTDALIQELILRNLREAFAKQGPLEAEDLTGILKTINHSIGTWNTGMRGQGYLQYLEGFLGQMGVKVRLLSSAEAKKLGLV